MSDPALALGTPLAMPFGHILPGEAVGPTRNVVGDLVTIKVPSSSTGNQFCAFEELTAPNGGPPPHHHPQAELFYVLAGEVQFMHVTDSGPQLVTGGPGSIASIPGSVVHTFKNVGADQSKVFVISTPGGLDRFFEDIGDVTDLWYAPGTAGPPDMERILAASAKWGVHFVDPS
jgi:quercetin dioxygenase-like cupin family protein